MAHKFTISKGLPKQDSLRINQRRRRVNGNLAVVKFVDKDTHQIVAFCPALDISGYGATEEKAIQMLYHSLDDLFAFLVNLSVKDLHEELLKMGWKKHGIFNKEFSHAYVDVNGNLQNMNAVDSKIERFSLTTA